MKRIAISLMAATFMIVSMSACEKEEPQSQPVSSYTESSPTEDTDLEADEQLFVDALRDEFGDEISPDDDDLVELGDAVCESLDAGYGIYATAYEVGKGGFNEYDSGFIVGAAIGSLCTEHMDLVTDEEGEVY